MQRNRRTVGSRAPDGSRWSARGAAPLPAPVSREEGRVPFQRGPLVADGSGLSERPHDCGGGRPDPAVPVSHCLTVNGRLGRLLLIDRSESNPPASMERCVPCDSERCRLVSEAAYEIIGTPAPLPPTQGRNRRFPLTAFAAISTNGSRHLVRFAGRRPKCGLF